VNRKVYVIYTVIHKKTWQFICGHNSGKLDGF